MSARSRSACASARRAQRHLQQTVLWRVLHSPVASLQQAPPPQRGAPARVQGLATRLAVSALCWSDVLREGGANCPGVLSAALLTTTQLKRPSSSCGSNVLSCSACCTVVQARALKRLDQVPGRRVGLPRSSSRGKSPQHPPRRRAGSRLLRAARRRCAALLWLLPACRRLRSLSRS